MTFIVGMGRSGTTLLTNMLNSHPSVIACPENEFVIFTARAFQKEDFTKQTTVDAFVNLFHYRFSKVISFWTPEKGLKDGILGLSHPTYPEVCKQVYLHYPFADKNKEKVTCLVDKNPVYSLYIDDLYRLFPDARFIVLTRDYRDNIVSRKKYSDKESSLYTLAESWNYFYERIFRSIRKNNLEYMLLRYEDLVDQPSETLNKLCTFLDITFDERMLQFQELSKGIKNYIKQNLSDQEYAKLTAMHHNLENQVNVNRVASYKKELTDAEIGLLDFACRYYGKELGYKPEHPVQGNPAVGFRLWVSHMKVQLYYYLHSLRLRIPLSWRLRFATRK